MSLKSLPPYSMSAIYEDDRFRDKFAITIRGQNVVETHRFEKKSEATKAQRNLKQAGFVIRN